MLGRVSFSVMRWFFFALLGVHGLIHLLGFVKAFGWYDPPQLTVAISKSWGLGWLAAALAMVVAAVLVAAPSRIWWVAGLAAAILSQVVILSAWTDAKFGTVANVLVLVGVAYGLASQGPFSFAAEYRQAIAGRLGQPVAPATVTDENLVGLPPPVQRFLRQAGVVGSPRVHNFKATWRGRIRQKGDDPWMEFTAEQHNFPREPSRFFFMKATRSGLPVDVYHAFADQSATMRVRLLSLFPMVDAHGPEMTRAETVTLFNDLALLAPAELVDASIRWEPIDEQSARGFYTVGANTISAVLHFNEADQLVDFVSDDRLAASASGTQFVRQRWSTPVLAHGTYDSVRVLTRGEGRWHPSEGDYAYLEIELLDLQINATGRP